ncbi:MAG: hypothetical protein M1833_003927 [Piccolia ochrophora]|nr:MAG: hypothetical protein M1833_003927 [Piccolia ochrophora]
MGAPDMAPTDSTKVTLLDTPAMITLRRASVQSVAPTVGAKLMPTFIGQLRGARGFSGEPAFQVYNGCSKYWLPEFDPVSSAPMDAGRLSPVQQDRNQHASLGFQELGGSATPRFLPKRPLSLLSALSVPSDGAGAETATSFVEVKPEVSISVSPERQVQYQKEQNSSQGTSTFQIISSRGSVYEIIWKEDHALLSTRSRTLNAQQESSDNPSGDDAADSASNSADFGLIRWSWDSVTTGQSDANAASANVLQNESAPDSANSTYRIERGSSDSNSIDCKGSGSIDFGEIDKLSSSKFLIEPTDQSKAIPDQTALRTNTIHLHPCAKARVADPSKIGFALGTSSGKRRKFSS